MARGSIDAGGFVPWLRKLVGRARRLPRLLGFGRAPPRVTGSHDGVRDGALYGWARDAGRPDGRTDVILETDTGRTLVVHADVMRGDVRAAGFGDGYHGFRVSLARLGPGARRVTARAAESDRALRGSPLDLPAQRADHEAASAAHQVEPPGGTPLDLGRWQGRLDPPRPGVVSGWLVDTEEPGRRPMVELHGPDGRVLARDRACRHRPDAPPTTGDHMVGFEIGAVSAIDVDGRTGHASQISVAGQSTRALGDATRS